PGGPEPEHHLQRGRGYGGLPEQPVQPERLIFGRPPPACDQGGAGRGGGHGRVSRGRPGGAWGGRLRRGGRGGGGGGGAGRGGGGGRDARARVGAPAPPPTRGRGTAPPRRPRSRRRRCCPRSRTGRRRPGGAVPPSSSRGDAARAPPTGR